jgi:hypothetical protein
MQMNDIESACRAAQFSAELRRPIQPPQSADREIVNCNPIQIDGCAERHVQIVRTINAGRVDMHFMTTTNECRCEPVN